MSEGEVMGYQRAAVHQQHEYQRIEILRHEGYHQDVEYLHHDKEIERHADADFILKVCPQVMDYANQAQDKDKCQGHDLMFVQAAVIHRTECRQVGVYLWQDIHVILKIIGIHEQAEIRQDYPQQPRKYRTERQGPEVQAHANEIKRHQVQKLAKEYTANAHEKERKEDVTLRPELLVRTQQDMVTQQHTNDYELSFLERMQKRHRTQQHNVGSRRQTRPYTNQGIRIVQFNQQICGNDAAYKS